VPSALSSPRLRRIITAYTVNRLGSWLGYVAIALVVFDHTHSALAVAAVLLCAEALPAFLVPVLVAWVEASPRNFELSGLYFFEAVVTIAIAVVFGHFWLPAILFLSALDGLAALAASSLLRAGVAHLAREELSASIATHRGVLVSPEIEAEAEKQVNATLGFGLSASSLGGPVLGGIATAALGGGGALLIDAASFVACGLLLLDLRPHVDHARGEGVRARLSAGWRHINNVPVLRALFLAQAAALVFIQAGSPIEVVYTKGTLHAGDAGYGLFVTAWGGGSMLGSLLFGRAKGSLHLLLTIGILTLSGAFVWFWAAPSFATACAGASLAGVGNGIVIPALMSAVQRPTPAQLQSVVIGATESLISVTLAAGLALGGGLVLLISARNTFLTLGLGAAVVAILFLRTANDSDSPDAAGPTGDPPTSERDVAADPTDSRAALS
jgi:DHA3 family macrolide efflux protein-like MFS transporter